MSPDSYWRMVSETKIWVWGPAPILVVTANSSKVVLLTLQLFAKFPVKIFAGLGLPFALDKRGCNLNIVNNMLPNIHPDS